MDPSNSSPPFQRKNSSSQTTKRPKVQRAPGSKRGGSTSTGPSSVSSRGSSGRGRGARRTSTASQQRIQIPEPGTIVSSAAPTPRTPLTPGSPFSSVPPTPREPLIDPHFEATSELVAIEGGDKGGKADEGAEEEEEEDEHEFAEIDFQQMQGRTKEDLKALIDNFSEEQLQRYEVFRRSSLNKANVKRLVGQVLNQTCSPTLAFVVAGFSKVFVGEIVEKARQVQKDWDENGALTPDQLREAFRRYKQESDFTHPNYKKRLFCR